jgi:hypothetical protein
LLNFLIGRKSYLSGYNGIFWGKVLVAWQSRLYEAVAIGLKARPSMRSVFKLCNGLELT